MLGLICLAWLYLRKLKLQCGGKYHPSEEHVEEVMRTSACEHPPLVAIPG